MSKQTPVDSPSAWIIDPATDESEPNPARVFGLTPRDRLERTLARHGAGPLRLWESRQTWVSNGATAGKN